MARIKYHYDPETCRYEPYYIKGKTLRQRTAVFIGVSLALALIGCCWYVSHYTLFEERILTAKNEALKTEWSILEQRIKQAKRQLAGLVEKDDRTYRVILDTEPLPLDVRKAGVGGSVKFNQAEIAPFPSVLTNYKQLDNLSHQLDIELQSFRELKELANTKIKMWASRPAIQPINNTQLDRLHMTYGPRMHPIFHVYLDHKGLDFAASKGTPVYATGDGKVTMAYFSESYGNVIYLNHGHGYETRYAHLSGFNVHEGEKVKRGQVIGYVGNTGNSVSAHLHYEVLFNNQHVNPINFFQRDLSNNEYEKLIELGRQQTKALD